MKVIFCLAALAAASVALADPYSVAKQRAKETVNQNNVRQGIGAPAAPTQPPAAQPGRQLPADPVSKLKATLTAVSGSTSVSAEQKKQLTTEMLACARGSKKPSLAAVEKFANSLSAALAGQSLEASVVSRLAQDINLAFNSASLSAQRGTEISDDVQAILQTAGQARGSAMNIAGELKAIVAELQDGK